MKQEHISTRLPVFQQTIAREINIAGVGLHSGKTVNLSIKPAPANFGVQFCRVDLDAQTSFRANATDITDTQLCTVISKELSSGERVKIGTVEHVLSALSGLNIDNVLLEIDAPEMPIVDGSAAPFVYLLQEAGIKVQNTPRKYLRVVKPVSVEADGKWAKLSPTNLGFQVDFTIDFIHPAIKKSKADFSALLSPQRYIKEISRARTFGFLKDIELLRQHNLALGGTLDNAVVLDDYRVMNENGLRYDDEFVRHKALDAIGDLYVTGVPIIGHYQGYKSGHALNNDLLRAVLADASAYVLETPTWDTLTEENTLLSGNAATLKI